jgi:hypothetical protein
MPNHEFRLTSFLNINFDHVVDSGIPEDEWAELSDKEKGDVRDEVVWEHIEVSDVTE